MKGATKGDPYSTIARQSLICQACGKAIKKGDKIYIWPRHKGVRCKCSEQDYLDCRAAIVAEDLQSSS